MIVKANKTLKHKELRKRGEVFRVSEEHGKQLVESGLVTEVKQGHKDRQTKPSGDNITYKAGTVTEVNQGHEITYKEAGPYVQKFVDGEKVESLYKSQAKEEWGWDG